MHVLHFISHTSVEPIKTFWPVAIKTFSIQFYKLLHVSHKFPTKKKKKTFLSFKFFFCSVLLATRQVVFSTQFSHAAIKNISNLIVNKKRKYKFKLKRKGHRVYCARSPRIVNKIVENYCTLGTLYTKAYKFTTWALYIQANHVFSKQPSCFISGLP